MFHSLHHQQHTNMWQLHSVTEIPLKFMTQFNEFMWKRRTPIPNWKCQSLHQCVRGPTSHPYWVPFNPGLPKDLDRGVFLSKNGLLTPSLPGCLVDNDLSKAALNSAWLSKSKWATCTKLHNGMVWYDMALGWNWTRPRNMQNKVNIVIDSEREKKILG